MVEFKNGDRVVSRITSILYDGFVLYREGDKGTVVSYYDDTLLVKWDSEESHDDGLWYINEKDVDKLI